MKRWVCPICNVGANGPARPRANATVRFCLTCSADSDTLVERVLPSREREKQRQREASERRTQARELALTIDGVRIDLEARRLCALGVVRRAVPRASWQVVPNVDQTQAAVGIRMLARDRSPIRAIGIGFKRAAHICAAAVRARLVKDLAFLISNYGECNERDLVLAAWKGDERAEVMQALTADRVAQVVDAP